MNRSFFRENVPLTVGLIVTAIGISVSAIVFHQQFWRILPLYDSLVISLLSSRLSRSAPLLGGINSVLYAVVYYCYALYGSAASALFVSCPVQIATFILWSKKPWGQTTVFKKLSVSQRILTAAAYAAALAVMTFVLSSNGGRFALLDGMITVNGILSTLLMLFAFREYAPISAFGVILSGVLYILMLPENPEQTTYLVFNVYSFACTLAAAVRIGKVCDRQSREKEK